MKRALILVILVGLPLLNGCSSFNNSISALRSDLSNAPATVTCYSGGKEVYKTITTGKVTTGTGDMAIFRDSQGHIVEAFADCFYVYDVRP